MASSSKGCVTRCTQVSANDFLGQCELEFGGAVDVAAGGAQPSPRWVPLYGFSRGRRMDAGEVQVAVWFESAGNAGEHGERSRPAGLSPRVQVAGCLL